MTHKRIQVKTLDRDTARPPRMVHLAHPSDPSPIPHTAWCGAPLAGNAHPPGTPLDCIVCEDLWKAWDGRA